MFFFSFFWICILVILFIKKCPLWNDFLQVYFFPFIQESAFFISTYYLKYVVKCKSNISAAIKYTLIKVQYFSSNGSGDTWSPRLFGLGSIHLCCCRLRYQDVRHFGSALSLKDDKTWIKFVFLFEVNLAKRVRRRHIYP